MGASGAPKQYLELAGRTVIEWALAPFLADAHCEQIVVVLAAEDRRWRELPIAAHPKILIASGGAERIDSVRAGLSAIASGTQPGDWILVHDAARPCLSWQDLQRLITEVWDDEVGGLLAAPVVDTLKRADDDARSIETVSRAALWRALTPQMFRFGLLNRALTTAANEGRPVTDEAQAIEAQGLKPRLVAGDPDNLKITVPGDLRRAERVLGDSTRPQSS
jgi:2-C-methyl-D-erythritol 4-phosphate cytidylyltransferase